MNQHSTYELKESHDINLSADEEKIVDLQLKKSQNPCSVTLYGRVMNRCYQPIVHAPVKIIDSDGNVRCYTVTEENGAFACEIMLEKGIYKVVASADHYFSTFKSFEIFADCMRRVIKFDYRLEQNKITEQSILYGVAYDSIAGKPISKAKITLAYQGRPSKIVATVFTNENGQYIIYGILPNEYQLNATHATYIPFHAPDIKVEPKQVALLNLNMMQDHTVVDGTIRGMVRLEGRIAGGVPVFLYAVDDTSFYRLVQVEMTNANGEYLFTSVPPGQYVVDTHSQNRTEISG